VKLASLALCAILAAPVMFAQKLDLKFETLAAKAADKTEVDLDTTVLKVLMQLGGMDGDEHFLRAVKAIRVRSYNFKKDGEYSQNDLEAVRKQVSAQSRFARVVNSKEGESTAEIWVALDGDKLGACVIVAAEPREVSVVYLEGTLSLADIRGFLDHDGMHDLVHLAGR
jgi:hypothetical protein